MMIDREKVIKGLEEVIAEAVYPDRPRKFMMSLELAEDALALLKAQESVVRCRDCKYGKICFDADGHGLIQCTNTNYPAANVETWPLELDWFCAGGERRDGE